MTNDRKPCAATTKSGEPCKNKAQDGSDYCYVHRALAAQAEPKSKKKTTKAAPAPQPSVPAAKNQAASHPQFNELIVELDKLVSDLRAQIPEYAPPPFSPHALVALLKENLHRFTPEMQLDIVSQLKSNLEGTTPQDLVDPETWKGMWYILNYSMQLQSKAISERLSERLSGLPGVAFLSDLKGNLEGTSPKDLLDVDTWKGAWYILNHSLRVQADEVKRKLLGGAE